MAFLHSTETHNVYEFDCPGCEASGEIGIPKGSGKLVFHECGTGFIQQPGNGGPFSKPEMVVV